MSLGWLIVVLVVSAVVLVALAALCLCGVSSMADDDVAELLERVESEKVAA